MPTFSTSWCHKPGPTLWLYNPLPSSPSFPSRHLQEQFKTTPTTTPTPSGCRISPPPSPTTSRSVPPPAPPHRSPPPRFLYRRCRRPAPFLEAPPRHRRPHRARSSIYVADASRPPVSRDLAASR